MSDDASDEKPISDEKPRAKSLKSLTKLRTTDELSAAHEWLFNQQKDGKIDSKTADALNTTLKGAVYLNGKLKLDALKLYVQAEIKKIAIPKGMLPD